MKKLLAFYGAVLCFCTTISINANAKILPVTDQGRIELEEIIVTARKREERLQEVPVAISVMTEQVINSVGIERPADYIALIPNVSFAAAQDVGAVAVNVRGIGQIRNGETPVAVVVDGVLQNSPFQYNQDLLDVTQIEVLKGPQGALYGRNAIAGAINITTAPPGDVLEGHTVFSAGNGDYYRTGVTLHGPLLEDVLAFRATLSHREAGGWIKNQFLNEEVDDFDEDVARLRLIYNPTEALEIDFRLNHSELDGGSAWFALTSNANRAPGVAISDVANTKISPTANNLGTNERELLESALKIDYANQWGTWSSVTAFTDTDLLVTFDGADFSDNSHCISFNVPLFDVTPCGAPSYFGMPFNTLFQDYEVSNWSQELRFTSLAERKLRYIFGLYYLQRNRDLVTGTQEDLGIGIIPELDFDPATLNATRHYFSERNDNRAWAAFGQLNYDISDTLEFSVALRYDRDKRRQKDPRPDQYRLSGLFMPVTGARIREAVFEEVQPRVTLSYKPEDRISFYGSFAEGFRSGGFNAPGTDVALIGGIPVKISDSVYKKETSRNYELGFKSQWLGRSVTVNGAAFYSDVDNIQVFNWNGFVNAQIVNNIDRVNISGAELEMVARSSRGLTVYAGLGYADTEIQKMAGNPAAKGNQVPLNIKFSSNLGVEYRGMLLANLEGFIRVDWEHKGETSFHEGGHFSGVPVRDPVNLVNMRMGVELGEHWAVNLWARNITDKFYYEEVTVPDYVFQARPRSYGMDLRLNF